jgi:putative Mg2+ transporter-C (MgtC) family protein
MDYAEFLIRIAVAMAGGAAIGLERQWRQRMAGLRTNTLVSVGAALFVIISAMAQDEISPTRIAAQVVSGIGFIGAGVIIREGLNVRGLNTAATLWCSAAVGALAGTGSIYYAGLGAAAILGANIFLRPIQNIINRQPLDETELEVHYRLQVTCRQADEIPIRKILLESIDASALSLRSLHSEDTELPGTMEVYAELRTVGRKDNKLESIVAKLCVEAGVTSVSWKIVT